MLRFPARNVAFRQTKAIPAERETQRTKDRLDYLPVHAVFSFRRAAHSSVRASKLAIPDPKLSVTVRRVVFLRAIQATQHARRWDYLNDILARYAGTYSRYD